MMSGAPVIDKIFNMVCVEAVKMGGDDLEMNMVIIMTELNVKVSEFIPYIKYLKRKKP